MSQNLNRFFRIYLRLAALTLVVCTLLRIVLLFNEQTSELGFGFLQWVAVFGLGALNDLCDPDARLCLPVALPAHALEAEIPYRPTGSSCSAY